MSTFLLAVDKNIDYLIFNLFLKVGFLLSWAIINEKAGNCSLSINTLLSVFLIICSLSYRLQNGKVIEHRRKFWTKDGDWRREVNFFYLKGPYMRAFEYNKKFLHFFYSWWKEDYAQQILFWALQKKLQCR